MSQRFKKFVLFLFVFAPMAAIAQHHYVITFDEKGRIVYYVPSLLKDNDKLTFQVKGTNMDYNVRLLNTYNRFIDVLNNLDAMDDGKNYYLVLYNANLQDAPEAKTHLKLVKSNLARQLLDLIADAQVSIVLRAGKRDLDADSKKLKSFLVDNDQKLNLPVIKDMIKPNYFVNNFYSGGLNDYNNNQLVCKDVIELSGSNDCCSFTYTSAQQLQMEKYKATTFFFDSLELRLHNSTYFQFHNQLNQFVKTTTFIDAIDYQTIQKTLKAKLDQLKSDTDTKKLLAYFEKRYQSGKDVAADHNAMNAVFTGATATTMQGKLTNLIDGSFAPFTTDKNVDFLLDIAWLSGGKSLTANPLEAGTPDDLKTQLGDANQVLTDSTNHLNKVTGLLDELKTISGTASAGNNTMVIQRRNSALMDLKDQINAGIKKQKALIDQINKKIKAGNLTLNNPTAMLSDSLLYAGTMIVNHRNGGILFSPNNIGYHYMRSHNALQGLNYFDLKTKKGINEEQYLNAFIINANRNSKYVFTTSFADATNNVDIISQQIANNPAAGPPPPVTVESLYTIYAGFLNLFNPYQKGIIGSSVIEGTDQTADFISVPGVVNRPEESNKIGTYTMQDTSVKNNKPYSCTFRFNKLYRFDLKAGIAYSWLNRRSYTINTTNNTATYTDNYQGLAPTLGIQIFTSRFDPQNPQILPSGIYPFFYVGYMFHDAPANNFLFGGGFEIFSGFAFAGGVHLGKTQGLTVQQGILTEKDHYITAPFISVNIGIQAFMSLFSPTAKLPAIITK